MSSPKEQVTRVLQEVLWNAANHPVPHAVLGQDITPLTQKCVEAVLPVVAAAYEEGYQDGFDVTLEPDREDYFYCCEECDGY